MSMTLSGDGTISGLTAGGLPDATVVTDDILDANITAAKLSGAQDGSAPVFGARAWVRFVGNGSVGSQTITGSGNVTSVTKNSTGNYTINFTTELPNANYAVSGTANFGAVGGTIYLSTAATSSVTITTHRADADNPTSDCGTVSIVIFG